MEGWEEAGSDKIANRTRRHKRSGSRKPRHAGAFWCSRGRGGYFIRTIFLTALKSPASMR
jgi:hypothetical protein